jgi:hypothetical protein
MPPARRKQTSPEQISRHLICGLWLMAVTMSRIAVAEDSPTQNVTGNQWWSLRPLKTLPPPKVQNEGWPRTPIDRFILARLEEMGLQPSQTADKRTLLRRVILDLTGLPPTPEEMRAFLQDPAPDAYEKVVDRLLASPRYGERWARHWLDVVHYADTHGHDQDRPRTNSWPYRDYVIRSLNEDKPYRRFVEEQLAGDVLYPEDPNGIIATGFIATGPWDESSQMHIMADTVDKKIAQNLDRDDMLTTAISTFVSTTVHCARCHDHKFDPIPQTEYYNLQAVFAGVDRAERPYDLDRPSQSLRQSLLKRRTAVEIRQRSLAQSPLEPELEAGLVRGQAAWEKQVTSGENLWTLLDPIRVESAGGATLTKQPDQSLLASGTRPEVDTYTIIATTDLQGITAVRLEVLPDNSLPQKGPGRQDNGNFHLSEIRISAASTTAPATAKPVPLQNPTADFNQKDWDISKALDGKTNTAWGIHPEIGKPHTAVFEIKDSIGFDGGTTLTFVLNQFHGQGHLIGRLRLSATAAPLPIRADPLPEPIVKILSVHPDQRSEAQTAELAAHYRSISPELLRVLDQINQTLASLPPPRMVYGAANDFKPQGKFTPAKVPRSIYLLKRGEVTRPGDLAFPGALAFVSEIEPRFQLANPNDEGSRRAALARWITHPKNPLTWRSLVNRVWHYHFGRGLVDTPNDFGRMGSRPTHSELLDWLAVNFRESGGSLKQLHRLIVTSAVYQQASRIPGAADVRKLGSNSEIGNRHADQENQSLVSSPAAALEIDADNRYLWRMNRTRLDAESLRDSILSISGKLDLAMGGPSVKQFHFEDPDPGVTPKVDYARFDVDSSASFRRSVYRWIFRTIPDPFMDSLDCPDSSQLAPQRNHSVTPLQALALLNNHFVVRQSEHFAERLIKAHSDLGAQIKTAFELAFGREPSLEESKDLASYASKHGLANACRVIFNSNEFMFVN